MCRCDISPWMTPWRVPVPRIIKYTPEGVAWVMVNSDFSAPLYPSSRGSICRIGDDFGLIITGSGDTRVTWIDHELGVKTGVSAFNVKPNSLVARTYGGLFWTSTTTAFQPSGVSTSFGGILSQDNNAMRYSRLTNNGFGDSYVTLWLEYYLDPGVSASPIGDASPLTSSSFPGITSADWDLGVPSTDRFLLGEKSNNVVDSGTFGTFICPWGATDPFDHPNLPNDPRSYMVLGSHVLSTYGQVYDFDGNLVRTNAFGFDGSASSTFSQWRRISLFHSSNNWGSLDVNASWTREHLFCMRETSRTGTGTSRRGELTVFLFDDDLSVISEVSTPYAIGTPSVTSRAFSDGVERHAVSIDVNTGLSGISVFDETGTLLYSHPIDQSFPGAVYIDEDMDAYAFLGGGS